MTLNLVISHLVIWSLIWSFDLVNGAINDQMSK